jgi:DGQHR domain-containing protein
MGRKGLIRRRAIKIKQSAKHPVFLFTLTAEELLQVADISRVSRDEAGKLIGYQRAVVKRHVKNIVEYLNSDEVVFPNSIILALSSETKFRQVRGPKVDDGLADAGTIEIPLPRAGRPKPGWIVDGQQRALALSHCKRQQFPVPISAFIADEVDIQRDQFLRVNNTKPLPRGLISELLPLVSTLLPANLAARKVPSAVCEILSADPESPFFGMIKRASTEPSKRKAAVIADTVIVKMLHESLTTAPGCLFPYRNLTTGETDFPTVRAMLILYWAAVRDTFPDAWGLPPTESRLMHSAGLRAMGRLMDRIMSSIDVNHPKASRMVRDELARIRPFCRWTDGVWEDLGNLRWNDLQNIPSHVRLLSSHLVRAYVESRRAVA